MFRSAPASQAASRQDHAPVPAVLAGQPTRIRTPFAVRCRQGLQILGCLGLACLTAWSAILVKEAGTAPPLARVVAPDVDLTPASLTQSAIDAAPVVDPLNVEPVSPIDTPPAAGTVPAGARLYPEGTRFFNGRPIRPVRTVRMKVTAYSPDAASCGDSADGITATLHHVTTNDFRLVASDPRILPYGSMISVPGYDEGNVVPVLDCGGAIKGNRLDVLYPTHALARKWGVKFLDVTVWGYADGGPKDNPRKLR